jgi:REP element-mobilizing transposase RayT
MGRPKRISFPGAIYHICVHGNNSQIIFRDDHDCHRFLELLRLNKQRYGFFIHAYILLPNHFHLVIQITDQASISKIMQILNTAYSRYFNKRYEQKGHLLENRFLSNLVSRDKYLLELTRYVHLNPIRLGIANSPQDYKWSSFQVYMGSLQDSLVDKEAVLDLLDQDKARQPQLYGEFVMAQVQDGAINLKEVIAKNRILGNEEFVQKIKQDFGIGGSGVRGRPRKQSVE